jgi:hypothetical protein
MLGIREKEVSIMRIHDKGDYAYDLEQTVDSATQLRTGWNFRVFLLRPTEQVIESGQAKSREEAEKQAKRVISKIYLRERRAA